jgi:hypothetical protein
VVGNSHADSIGSQEGLVERVPRGEVVVASMS